MGGYEGFYLAAVHLYFKGASLDVRTEVSVNEGRFDMRVRHAGQVFLFEFKVVERAGEGVALKQIEQRGYANQYLNQGEPVHLIGAEFSAEKRNLVALDVKSIPPA